MKHPHFIPLLARMFMVLFYGQIAFALLAILFPLFMTYRAKPIRKVSPLPQARGTVVVDSVVIGGRQVAALRDTTGTYDRKIVSYPTTLTIASVQQVDSLFMTNLNCDYVETRDGYAVARPIYGASFGIALPIGGRINAFAVMGGQREGNPSADHRNAPWYHRLSVAGPIIKISESSQRQDDMLQIEMSTWQDWLAVPLMIKLSMFLTFLPVVFSAMATYQFWKLFERLSQREMFTESQLHRVNYIGYYALVYVLTRLGADLYRTVVARQYIVDKGFTAKYLFQTPVLATLTVQWSWLLTGLCVLALAQVFKYGVQLKQENELTI